MAGPYRDSKLKLKVVNYPENRAQAVQDKVKSL